MPIKTYKVPAVYVNQEVDEQGHPTGRYGFAMTDYRLGEVGVHELHETNPLSTLMAGPPPKPCPDCPKCPEPPKGGKR